MTESARDSAQRARTERLSRSDPEDLLPVPQIPRGRTARYTLRDVNGASFREPRWFGDGKRLLVIRSDYRPDGSLRPDLFEWMLETGRVRRITHGATISDADVLPGDTISVGTRCYAGQCDLMRIDLRTGAMHMVLAGDPYTQYARPRAMPDGQHVVASVQSRGVWRPVRVHAFAGVRADIGPDVPWDRYDVTPTREGDAVLLTSEESGTPQLVRYTLASGREQAVSRVFGAAMAPSPFPGDSSLLFLSLHPRGYELRRLTMRDTGVAPVPPALRARLSDPRAGAVVTQPPRGGGMRFDTASAIRTRAYGVGSQRMNLFPMGAGGRDGYAVGGAIGGSDAVGRFGWMLLGMGGGDARAERGGALRATARTPRATFIAELNRAFLPITSRDAMRDREYASDAPTAPLASGNQIEASSVALSGASFSAELARRDLRGHTGLRFGVAVHGLDGRASIATLSEQVVPDTDAQSSLLDRSGSATRWHGYVELQRTMSGTVGPADIRFDVRGHVSRTHNALASSLYHASISGEHQVESEALAAGATGAVTRHLLQARLSVDARGPLSLTYDALVGGMRGESVAEAFRVGGLPPLLVNASVLPQRIPAPWLSAGTLAGREVASHTLRWRSLRTLTPFVSAVRSSGPWLRTAGVSADLSQHAAPFSRVPGIAATMGVGFVLDVPRENAVRAWAGVTYTP